MATGRGGDTSGIPGDTLLGEVSQPKPVPGKGSETSDVCDASPSTYLAVCGCQMQVKAVKGIPARWWRIPGFEPAYTLNLGWLFAMADRLRAKAQGEEPPKPNLNPRQIVFSYATAKSKKKVVVKPDGSLQIFRAVH